MDFPGDARPFGQGGRLVLGRVRAAGLLQGRLGLLGPEQVSAAGQAERPQADERRRVPASVSAGAPTVKPAIRKAATARR